MVSHKCQSCCCYLIFLCPKTPRKKLFFLLIFFFSVINILICPKNLKLFWKFFFFFFIVGRMATCGEALRWAKDCCFIKKKKIIGYLRFLGQIQHLKIQTGTVLKGGIQPRWSVPSNLFLYNLLYVT